MISIDKLEKVHTVVVHKNCPDGMASAILLADALPDVTVRFVQYGTKELAEIEPVPGLLFCDVTPPADRAERFLEVGTIVLDHHKTQRDITLRFEASGLGRYADNEGDDPGVSGAGLAYLEVWRTIFVEKFAASDWTKADWSAAMFSSYAGTRDTWQTDSIDWETSCAQAMALTFYPEKQWVKAVQAVQAAHKEVQSVFTRRGVIDRMLDVGYVLLSKRHEDVSEVVRKAYRFQTTYGLRVVTFNSTSLTSDAAEKLGKDCDLIVGFKYETDGGENMLVLSTRSHTGFDCAAFCKKYGGGGHAAAAACSFRYDPNKPTFVQDPVEIVMARSANPYEFVVKILEMNGGTK